MVHYKVVGCIEEEKSVERRGDQDQASNGPVVQSLLLASTSGLTVKDGKGLQLPAFHKFNVA
jgi:hypothetical protein